MPRGRTTPFDLRTFGVIDNTYLIVRPQPGGMYRVSFRTNMNPGNDRDRAWARTARSRAG